MSLQTWVFMGRQDPPAASPMLLGKTSPAVEGALLRPRHTSDSIQLFPKQSSSEHNDHG